MACGISSKALGRCPLSSAAGRLQSSRRRPHPEISAIPTPPPSAPSLTNISFIINDFYLRNTDWLSVMFGNCDERQLQVARRKRQLAVARFHEFLVVVPDGLRSERDRKD